MTTSERKYLMPQLANAINLAWFGIKCSTRKAPPYKGQLCLVWQDFSTLGMFCVSK